MNWIPGAENPADSFTVVSGFKRWNDNDLTALAISATSAEAVMSSASAI
jgi:hypothetical protein